MNTTITIKQISDELSEAIGLDKHGRSKLPGTFDRLQAAENTDGRYLTGFDEESITVPKEDKEGVREKREALQKASGKKDLSGTSDFWKSYYVVISADDDLILNMSNPMHEIAYLVLAANKYIAPTKEDISNPVYKDAKYYGFIQEDEVKEEVNDRKIRDKAIGKLSEIEDNVEKMTLVGQYLDGTKYSTTLGANTLYKLLREYIEQKDLKFARNFVKALSLSTEDIKRKVIVDKAFKARLIKFSKLGGKKGIYQFGQTSLGKTIEEVYTNLSSPEYSNDLLNIQEALETK